MGESAAGPPAHGADRAEVAAVLEASGAPVRADDLVADLIFAEAAASATVGIWRFRGGDWSVVLKVIRHGGGGSPMWQSGEAADHWYFWEREALAYGSGLLDRLGGGLRAPKCLGVFRRPDGGVGLWIEDLRHADAAATWDIDGYRAAAHRLGLAQGLGAADWADPEPWVARRWLRQYVDRRGRFLRILDDGAVWDHPLVRRHLPPGTRTEVAAIWDSREALLTRVEASPLCLCHNDLHPGNLFSAGDDVILIDWAFLGAGHLGEDPGNLVFDAVLDFFVEPGAFEDLSASVTAGYLAGVAASGLDADPAALRRAMLAVGAVKYFWIPLAMAEAAAEGRPTLNRRPLDEGLRWWAPLVPRIFEAAAELRADR